MSISPFCCHDILLLKIKAAGIDGTCLKLLKSYLHNQQQQSKVNGTISDITSINYGVPQGSILGPLVFIIFINDIADIIINTKVSLYADDTAFYLGGSDPYILSKELSNASNIFEEWCNYNRLTLNQKECKAMLFSTNRRTKTNFPILINGTKIEIVHEFKYLGVMLDKSLNFESHINMIRRKITFRLFIHKKNVLDTLPKGHSLQKYHPSVFRSRESLLYRFQQELS